MLLSVATPSPEEIKRRLDRSFDKKNAAAKKRL